MFFARMVSKSDSACTFDVTHEMLASTGLTSVWIVEFLLDEFMPVCIHKGFDLVQA